LRKTRFSSQGLQFILPGMDSVQGIIATIQRLSPAELEELRVWFEEYEEDQLELTAEVKAKLDESRREIQDPD
jgi:hypothetical protein